MHGLSWSSERVQRTGPFALNSESYYSTILRKLKQVSKKDGKRTKNRGEVEEEREMESERERKREKKRVR